MCGKLGVTSPTRLASISVVIPADLTAYLPSREVDRVDIAIGRIGRECRHQRVEIANRHALRCRPNDAHRHDRSAHCSAIERAGLRSRWRVTQIREKESHDAAGKVDFAEVDMSLSDIRTKAGIPQPEGERAVPPVEVQLERAFSLGKDRPRLPRPQTADFLKARE